MTSMTSNTPECNPLEYFFWDAVKQKVYEGWWERFQNIDELKKRIRQVWKQSYDLDTLEGNPAVSAKIESSSEGKWWPYQITYTDNHG